MGYGGHLVWTAVFRSLAESEGKQVRVAAAPCLSDLIAGCLYDRAYSYAKDPVFCNNPRLLFTEIKSKTKVECFIDRFFAGILRRLGLMRVYEWLIFQWTERDSRSFSYHLVHINMRLHSYAQRQTRRRMIWKTGGHAANIILRRFKISTPNTVGEFYLTSQEEQQAEKLLRSSGLGHFVAIDSDTKEEWFGRLRTWPFERWQLFANQWRAAMPGLPLVQVGVEKSKRLSGVVDLCGKTSLREAAWILKRSCLFVGSDGALMHAAAALGVRSLILWSGVNLPGFLGYPEQQRVLFANAPCAPCGNLGWCDFSHRCMLDLTVEDVLFQARQLLEENVLSSTGSCSVPG